MQLLAWDVVFQELKIQKHSGNYYSNLPDLKEVDVDDNILPVIEDISEE
nr:hypothetical protein [Moorena sp. SIOASIH]